MEHQRVMANTLLIMYPSLPPNTVSHCPQASDVRHLATVICSQSLKRKSNINWMSDPARPIKTMAEPRGAVSSPLGPLPKPPSLPPRSPCRCHLPRPVPGLPPPDLLAIGTSTPDLPFYPIIFGDGAWIRPSCPVSYSRVCRW